jgi:CRP-like cAMP-binding protein
MRHLDPLQALSGIPCLRSFPPQALEAIAESARLRAFRPRERMWAPGDPLPGTYLVVSGLVWAYLDATHTGDSLVSTLWSGDLLEPYPGKLREWATYGVAVSPVVQAALPPDAFHAVSAHDPTLARRILSDLAYRWHRQNHWDVDLRLVSLKQRLLLLFRRMADELGTATQEGVLLDFPLTYEIVAGLACVKRDHAGRKLQELTREGYLTKRPRFRWLVPDPDRLGQPICLPPVAHP